MLLFPNSTYTDQNHIYNTCAASNDMFKLPTKMLDLFKSPKQTLNKFVLHSVIFYERFPGSYKDLQITQKLACIKHIDIL